MKFSIVIPNITKNEEKLKLLSSCLSSFFDYHKGSQFLEEVIIVDDGSSKSYQDRIKLISDSYGVKLIAKEKNEGFSTTVNAGIKLANGDIVLLVNNDISFTQDVLSAFNEAFEKDQKIGIVGSLLFYPNGTIQHGGILRMGHAFTHAGWHKQYAHAPETHHLKYMIGVTGAMFGIRQTMIHDIGMFDETFFMACEDTQFCIRAWQGGWKVLYEPKIKAIHIEGGTRGASTHEKLSASIDTRNWYIQELKTNEKFLNWLKTIDLKEIDRRVSEANLVKQEDVKIEPIEQKQTVVENLLPKVGSKIIGIRRTGALGDVLMATPVIKELKRRYPNSYIMMATHCPDAVNGNQNISRIVREISEIQKETDIIYDLDMAYEMNPKMSVVDAYSKVVFGHPLSDRFLELSSGIEHFQQIMPLISTSVNFDRDKIVVVHMAVSWANRTWPKEYWASVVKNLATRGYKILVVGRGGDFRSELISGVINLVDRLSIPQVREIIKRANVFIGPDSGLMHVAQTTQTPIVGLFTVANPDYRVTRPNNFTPLIPKSTCKFCLHDEKPPVTFVGCRVGTLQCLKEITPAEIIKAVDQYI